MKVYRAIISSCEQCPEFQHEDWYCLHEDMESPNLHHPSTIPGDCPLPDADEEEGE